MRVVEALIISMAPFGYILQSENRPRVSPETIKSNINGR